MHEKDIIEMLLKRDNEGMNTFLQHYGPLMRYIIAPIVHNPHDQEDCLSKAAMRVWNKIEQFHPEKGSFKAWLTALTRNAALNYVRDARKENSFEEISENTPSPEPGPEEVLIRKEQLHAVQHAIGSLSSTDRMLFYRKYYYLQSIAQIASEMGMTERAVEGKLYRLKKRLQAMLGGERNV